MEKPRDFSVERILWGAELARQYRWRYLQLETFLDHRHLVGAYALQDMPGHGKAYMPNF
jgi:hypothetical protein